MNKNNRTQKITPTLKIVRITVLLLVLLMLILTFFLARQRIIELSLTPSLSASNVDSTLTIRDVIESSTLVYSTKSHLSSTVTVDVSVLSETRKVLNPVTETDEDLIILAVSEGSFSHLYIFHPSSTSFYQLTDGPWQDINPHLSPDGTRLLFSSNRNGFWDLYHMDLTNGLITQLTQTPQYDGNPSWSPDGLWFVHESYVADITGGNLDLFIRSVDGSQAPIRLTDDRGADFSPSWSPDGRHIAFISNQSGENDVWLADLDKLEDRLTNITLNQDVVETHPGWTSQGNVLSWSAHSKADYSKLFIWDVNQPDIRPREVNNGDWALWSPGGDEYLVMVSTPNENYLTRYDTNTDDLNLPLVKIMGKIEGMTWSASGKTITEIIDSLNLTKISPIPSTTPFSDGDNNNRGNRKQVVPLDGVKAPYPMLQSSVEGSFHVLRTRVAEVAGWDFLASLEEAFVPLTAPLGPGIKENWLYTGRAFRFSTSPIQAGWVIPIREDYGSQIYWRIFLRTRYQDGSQGLPMNSAAWNFTARLSGDPLSYENGGKLEELILPGYWIDFTALAASYGWERQPALSSWKIAYSGTRYNEFVKKSGYDWLTAMLDIYPRAALDTPTPVSSPTMTFTPTYTSTPVNTATRTPYLSPTPSLTSTLIQYPAIVPSITP